MRIIGLDPGLRNTGWGIIDSEGSRLSYVASGVVHSDGDDDLATRLSQLHRGIMKVFESYTVDEAGIEETFVNKNPTSTLKLGQARGSVILVPALLGIPVFEYSPNLIKKTVVGTGHAQKPQVATMVKALMPKCEEKNPDAIDALAVAVCHAYNGFTRRLEKMK